MRHFNIPVFIPELACPFRCVYCNQYNISGTCKAPEPHEVTAIVEKHLQTIDYKNNNVEIAFFGGSFTALPGKQQNAWLEMAKPWIDAGKIKGIRISTRPDYIDEEILQNLKNRHVTAIELGAQSLNDEVLRLAGRGHNASQIVKAAGMIRNMGFETGLQMMTGLPGDTEESAMETARTIIESGAQTTRIYPTLVIEDTDLAELYRQGKYQPQSLEEAADLCARLFLLFQAAGVKVLRMGLHPSESFYEGGSLIAGPFHPAFGEMAMTRVWYYRLNDIVPEKADKLFVRVHPTNINAVIGHKKVNKKWLQGKFKIVEFYAEQGFKKDQIHVDFY
ncbi:MAG: radical SAM protein [Bacteroidales bacterium]|nr:radical SAM protein [Bacteroidales bacterium]